MNDLELILRALREAIVPLAWCAMQDRYYREAYEAVDAAIEHAKLQQSSGNSK